MMNDAIYLLDGDPQSGKRFAALRPKVLRTHSQVREAFEREPRRRAFWIAVTANSMTILNVLRGSRTGDQRLLLLEPVDRARHGLLHALFRFVVLLDKDVKLLPADDIAEVIASSNRDDLFIGGTLDLADGTLVLYRGNLEPFIVPISWFNLPKGLRLSGEDFEVIDFGQTVRLGAIEAATEAILYEFDADARRRAKLRSRANDSSFGGALRRLRLQRGLSRDEFEGISAREIGRIERGEIANPRAATVAKLARRLGVKPDEIESF
jgi:hypothetical protein